MNLIGKMLAGRYLVESHLGEGGMGSVFRARDTELFHRTVVIKVPHASMLETPTMRERFQYEMESLTHLEHPHIIKILGAGEHEGVPFAVVQYVGGGDLRNRAPRGEQVTPQEILGWLPAVAGALDFVHQRARCHRDVKPANIFFDEQGNAFLSDFGIATAMEQRDPDETLLSSRAELTIAGTFIGSPSYAPPESIVREISPAYDQYSLAVTVYELLTGQLPHPERGEALLMAKNIDPPTPIRDLLPELPEAAADAVMRGLARKPRERHDSCGAFAEAFAAGLATPSRTAGPDRSVVAVGLALVGAGAATLLAWMLWADRPALDERGFEPQADPTGNVPVTYLAGSTSDELRHAQNLCREYADANDIDCDPVARGDAASHQVELRPFALDPEEVTNARFAAFVERTGHITEAERRGYSWHRNIESPGRTWREPMGSDSSQEAAPQHPVVHVSLTDATTFCESEGARLPSEEEWEFAARGSERRVFPWGNQFDEVAPKWRGSDVEGLEDVGSHPFGETRLGHQDLAGNVAEWTSTRVGSEFVIKGGSWIDQNPVELRGAARMIEDPDYTGSEVGFRCVRDASEWPAGPKPLHEP